MPNSQQQSNNSVSFGVVIPKSISIGALILLLGQGGVIVWNMSKYATSIDRTTDQIQQVATEINKVKSDIYTRSEANVQFEAIRREIELINKANERQDADVKELRGRK